MSITAWIWSSTASSSVQNEREADKRCGAVICFQSREGVSVSVITNILTCRGHDRGLPGLSRRRPHQKGPRASAVLSS